MFHRLTLVVALAAALMLLLVVPAQAAAPHRIISLSPTATESLFAIGAGKQVVAVDDQSDYPKRAPRTSLSGYTPNVEAVANYHPDLVLISYDPGNFASQVAGNAVRATLGVTFLTTGAKLVTVGLCRAMGFESTLS